MLNKQRGFGLIELLLGVALAGILGTGIATFTIQTFTESTKSNSRMQALLQVQNAGYWISRDVQMSANVTLGVEGGFPLELRWKDITNNQYQATYTLAGGQIKRELLKNSVENNRTLIAQDINPGLTTCEYSDGELFTLNVTATVDKNDISRTYIVKKRLDIE